MQKLASLVLDRYDDVDGSMLKLLDGSGFQEHVKTAQVFTRDELNALPDDTYAVILEQDGWELRKFSMADKGNTGLSVAFFLMNGDQLPLEAQKVAATNLVRGCEWYGLPVPEPLQKVALGLGTLIGGALVLPGAAQEASSNLKAIRGSGPGIMTPEQIKQRRLQMGV